MRVIAACAPKFAESGLQSDCLIHLDLVGFRIPFARIYLPEPDFDLSMPWHSQRVVVRTKAFSCNYRDKFEILEAFHSMRDDGFFGIGSEFVAEVVMTGSAVTRLQPGDRVIPNASWPMPAAPGVARGLPTVNGSQEFHELHEAQLIRIPKSMSDEVGASFSVGAQTAYAMLRRLGVSKGTTVLVTAARSNTSLFAIHALRERGARIFALTTDAAWIPQLEALGVEKVWPVPRNDMGNLADDPRISSVAQELGGFECVIDPFFDLYLHAVINLVAPGGRYTTVGLFDQFTKSGERRSLGRPSHDIMGNVMTNNISLIGNCFGATEDLEQAVADFDAGKLPVVMDSVFSGTDLADFLERTFNDNARFGKVVYTWDQVR
jgi:NADPH:quinone reductase and related Zn-dependent oxidoreductases